MGLTEKQIQRGIMLHLCNNSVRLPNYTPADWWENDVIRITKAGYWIEYEIKLSRSDYYGDRRKRNCPWDGPIETKHNILAANDGRGPKNFWFVCPWNVIRVENLPPWAGLINTSENKYGHMKFDVLKRAPNRKSKKCDIEFINGVNATGCRRLVYELTQGRLQVGTGKGN